MTDRRTAALERINSDQELKDEILGRIADNPAIGIELASRAAGASAAPSAPPPMTESILPAEVSRVSTADVGVTTAELVTADDARRVIESPFDGQSPGDLALEAIVRVLGRPVLQVRDDDFNPADADTAVWSQRLTEFHDPIKAAIRSVGRVELRNNPGGHDWVGTAWRVSDDVIVTNRHVAKEFAHLGAAGFVFTTTPAGPIEPRIDFREEHGGGSPAEFDVVEVLHIEDEPGPDLAFLRIDWSSGTDAADRAIIDLSESPVANQRLVVIGYPAKDTRTRMSAEMDRIFGNVYDVKRLAPGDVLQLTDDGFRFGHDATTLGGNSGSLVLGMETGKALGLHFAGRESVSNYAVAAPVVRERLETVLAARRVAAPAPVVSPKPPAADLGRRSGFDPAFLGAGHQVPLPTPSDELAAAVAPVEGDEDDLLRYVHYSVKMHAQRRLAMFTAVNIDGDKARNVRRANDNWRLDPRLAEEHQIGNELYRRNKFDRGHLVRRLDPAWGDSMEEATEAAEDTFFYTNSAPQHANLNQRTWLGLEDYILGNTDVHDLKVSVLTGPVYRDSDRDYRGILIPEDFWKVVAMVRDDTGAPSVTAYMLTQRDFMDDLEFAFGEYRTYQVPVAEVERQTGLDFGALKDADPLNAREGLAVRRLTSLNQIVV